MALKDNRIGIYEKAISDQFNWDDKIKIAKAAGFDYIEISIDESDKRLERLLWTESQRKFLKNILKKYNFSIDSICLSGHRRFPFGSRDEKIRERAYLIMEQAIDFALNLNIKNIQLAGYDVYYEESSELTYKRFIEGLKYSSKIAKEKGVLLSIEIMDTYLAGTISRAKKIIADTGDDYIKLYPDLGNLTQWSDDPSKELELGIDNIVAIHLKDTLPGVFKKVPFGKGTVDFPTLFKILERLKYDKPFLIEMWADNEKKYTIDESVKEIEEAKKWLIDRM